LSNIKKAALRELLEAALDTTPCSCVTPDKVRVRIAVAMVRQSGAYRRDGSFGRSTKLV